MRKFRPFADRVLVLPDAAPVKEGGLSVPTNQQDKATQGIVVAAAPRVIKYPQGSLLPSGFKAELTYNPEGVAVGDRVQFTQYGGRKAMHNGVEHRLFRLEELEGVIEDDEQTDSQR